MFHRPCLANTSAEELRGTRTPSKYTRRARSMLHQQHAVISSEEGDARCCGAASCTNHRKIGQHLIGTHEQSDSHLWRVHGSLSLCSLHCGLWVIAAFPAYLADGRTYASTTLSRSGLHACKLGKFRFRCLSAAPGLVDMPPTKRAANIHSATTTNMRTRTTSPPL